MLRPEEQEHGAIDVWGFRQPYWRRNELAGSWRAGKGCGVLQRMLQAYGSAAILQGILVLVVGYDFAVCVNDRADAVRII